MTDKMGRCPQCGYSATPDEMVDAGYRDGADPRIRQHAPSFPLELKVMYGLMIDAALAEKE